MASGNTLASYTAADNQPPSSSYATLDVRNGHLVLDFDASADEAAIFGGVLPRHYDSGGLTVRIAWIATSAVTGDVVWVVAFERHDDEGTDLDADSFASGQTATGAAPATSGAVQYTDVVLTNAQIDGLLAGESFRMRISRNADDAGDTMTGDAELLRVEVRET